MNIEKLQKFITVCEIKANVIEETLILDNGQIFELSNIKVEEYLPEDDKVKEVKQYNEFKIYKMNYGIVISKVEKMLMVTLDQAGHYDVEKLVMYVPIYELSHYHMDHGILQFTGHEESGIIRFDDFRKSFKRHTR